MELLFWILVIALVLFILFYLVRYNLLFNIMLLEWKAGRNRPKKPKPKPIKGHKEFGKTLESGDVIRINRNKNQ